MTNSYTGSTITIENVAGILVASRGLYPLTSKTAGTFTGLVATLLTYRLDIKALFGSNVGVDLFYSPLYGDTTCSLGTYDVTNTWIPLPIAFDTSSLGAYLVTPTGQPLPSFVYANRYLITVNSHGLFIFDCSTTINQYLIQYFPSNVTSQSRVQELLINIRYTLADTSKQRWSDERLVALLNEAQNDIAKRSDWFKYAFTYTFTGTSVAMDVTMLAIYKAEDINGVSIPFIQQDELDRLIPNWRTDVGTTADSIQYIIIDRSLTNAITVYPHMTLPTNLTITASVIPTPVDLVSSDLQLPIMADSALMYYVTGRALRDDLDLQNRTIGNEQLSLYEAELKKLLSNRINNYKRYSNRTIKFTSPFMRWDK